MAEIDGMNQNKRLSADPDTMMNGFEQSFKTLLENEWKKVHP